MFQTYVPANFQADTRYHFLLDPIYREDCWAYGLDPEPVSDVLGQCLHVSLYGNDPAIERIAEIAL